MSNRGADPRASQEPQGDCTLRLREAQSGPVPCVRPARAWTYGVKVPCIWTPSIILWW